MAHQQCIHAIFLEQAAKQRDAPAIEAHDGSYTYGQLEWAAATLSRTLKQGHVHGTRRVAVMMEKSALYSVTVLAVLMSGAAFVPLDPTHPEARLSQILDDVQPSVLLTSPECHDTAQRVARGAVVDVRSLLEPSPPPSPPRNTADTAARADDAAYIIFTSGSSGKAKGVVVSHGAFVASALARGPVTGLDAPGTRVLQYAAHTFDVSVDEIVGTLLHGGCVCVPSEAQRFDLAAAINALAANHALLTPTSAMQLHPADVPGLRTLQLGGEPLSDDVIARWRRAVRLFNVYGPTEASVACILREFRADAADEPPGAGLVIGRAVGCECHVVDPDHVDREQAPGVVGELVVSGPGVATGYLADAVRTAAAFFSAPARTPFRSYRTGDLVSMSAAGLVTIHGRRDNQIKVRGRRINVEEIEQAVLSCAHVEQVVVALPKAGFARNRLVAVVVPTTTKPPPRDAAGDPLRHVQPLDERLESALRAASGLLLPAAFVPAIWLHVPALPCTSSLKIDRKHISTWLCAIDRPARPESESDMPHPSCSSSAGESSPPEQDLLRLWSQVLDVPIHRLRPDASFVRNGGDSITAMELRRLAQAQGMRLDIKDILSCRTVHDLHRSCSAARLCESPLSDALALVAPAETPFPLAPVQQYYFNVTGDAPRGFVQSALLALKVPITDDHFRRIVHQLVQRHPALASRYSRHDETGVWSQTIPAPNHHMPCHITCDTAPSVAHARRALAALPIPQFDLAAGSLLHAYYTSCEDGAIVVKFCVHHLVIDYVSWRVFLDDLEALLRNEPLPALTMSFQTWCTLQEQYVDTLNPRDLLPYSTPPTMLDFWKTDSAADWLTFGASTQLGFSLSKASTQQILGAQSDEQGTEAVNAMLATFFAAFHDIFRDRETPTVFFETHGREPWHSAIDVSRTVGWFSAAYPLHVPAATATNFDAALMHVERVRRSTPANGHPYWTYTHLRRHTSGAQNPAYPIEFVFNYSAQFQRLDRQDSAFVRLSSVGEESAHPGAVRLSIFDVLASIENGCLCITTTLPKHIRHAARLPALMQCWRDGLEAFAHRLNDRSGPLHLPYDCPTTVSAAVERIQSEVGSRIRYVYRPSHIQQQMLHSQGPSSTCYWVSGVWRLRSPDARVRVDVDRIQRSWHQVVQNHANLRTVFVLDPPSQQHWAATFTTLQPTVVNLEANAKSPLRYIPTGDLSTPRAAHSLVLVPQDDGSVSCTFTFSHAIIDAHSRSIILRELADVYAGGLSGSPDTLDYRDYLNAFTYISAPPQLASCMFPTLSKPLGDVAEFATMPILIRGVRYTDECKVWGITIPSLFITAWNLVLSKYTGNTDVACAYVGSNRYIDVPDIDNAVGLFVDLRTCSLSFDPCKPLCNVASHVQEQCAAFMSSPIAQNHNGGHLTSMVNTMVNTRTAGAESMHVKTDALEMELEQCEDPWDFDLSLSIDHCGEEELQSTLAYRPAIVPKVLAQGVSDDLVRTINYLLNNHTASYSDWQACISR